METKFDKKTLWAVVIGIYAAVCAVALYLEGKRQGRTEGADDERGHHDRIGMQLRIGTIEREVETLKNLGLTGKVA